MRNKLPRALFCFSVFFCGCAQAQYFDPMKDKFIASSFNDYKICAINHLKQKAQEDNSKLFADIEGTIRPVCGGSIDQIKLRIRSYGYGEAQTKSVIRYLYNSIQPLLKESYEKASNFGQDDGSDRKPETRFVAPSLTEKPTLQEKTTSQIEAEAKSRIEAAKTAAEQAERNAQEKIARVEKETKERIEALEKSLDAVKNKTEESTKVVTEQKGSDPKSPPIEDDSKTKQSSWTPNIELGHFYKVLAVAENNKLTIALLALLVTLGAIISKLSSGIRSYLAAFAKFIIDAVTRSGGTPNEKTSIKDTGANQAASKKNNAVIFAIAAFFILAWIVDKSEKKQTEIESGEKVRTVSEKQNTISNDGSAQIGTVDSQDPAALMTSGLTEDVVSYTSDRLNNNAEKVLLCHPTRSEEGEAVIILYNGKTDLKWLSNDSDLYRNINTYEARKETAEAIAAHFDRSNRRYWVAKFFSYIKKNEYKYEFEYSFSAYPASITKEYDIDRLTGNLTVTNSQTGLTGFNCAVQEGEAKRALIKRIAEDHIYKIKTDHDDIQRQISERKGKQKF